MDAKKFGCFVAACRKEHGWTQADLAAQLHVTDKAVSRWERGIGFPDLATLEPLAGALGVSVVELPHGERLPTTLPTRQANNAVADALQLAHEQQRQERRRAFALTGVIGMAVLAVLFCDALDWAFNAILFTLLGVALPLAGLVGGLTLFGYGLWRKACGKSYQRTLWLALGCAAYPLCWVALLVLGFFLGLGPIPQ